MNNYLLLERTVMVLLAQLTFVNRLCIKEIIYVGKALKPSINQSSREVSDIPLCAVISEFVCVCVCSERYLMVQGGSKWWY
jgi:hypothetical protein